jgi:hypothetical protein
LFFQFLNVLPFYCRAHSRATVLAKVKVKAKVKFTLKQAMKAQKGSRGTALLLP